MLNIEKIPGKPFFVSIVSICNRTPEEAALEIEELHRLSGLEYFAVSFPLQPQGKEPLKKVENCAAIFRSLQCARKKRKIKVGILVQQTIGHGATWNPCYDRDLDWQRMIRNTGETSIRFCPLDSNFQRYITTAIRLVTAEKPDFLIIDDDCRLSFLPASRKVECFCPLHTAYFNQRNGTNYTPDGLRDAINQAKEHDPLQLQFVKSGMETISNFARILRNAADSVFPGIPMMLCSCHTEAGWSGIWAEELAAPGQPPVLRIGDGSYLEGAPRDIVFRQTDIANQKLYSPDTTILLDEADTCPHSRYSKSVRTMHLHIVTGLLNGLDGAKLWITDTMHPNPAFTKPYAAILKNNMGLYRKLHRIMKQFVRRGPLVELPSLEHAPFPAFPQMSPAFGGWVEGYLALFGLPFRWGKTGESGVHLIAGEMPDWFSDAELERILSEPTLLDADAARRLLLRGYGAKIGLTAVDELTIESSFEVMKSGTVLRKFRGSYSHLKILPGAEILSMLKRNPYYASPELSDVAPGVIRFGKIIITAWSVKPNNRIDMHPDRRDLLLQLLSDLDAVPARFVSDADAGFWFGDIENGRLMAAVNYSYDPLDECIFELKVLPAQLELLQNNGSWVSIPFTVSENRITVPVRLECAEFVILRLT